MWRSAIAVMMVAALPLAVMGQSTPIHRGVLETDLDARTNKVTYLGDATAPMDAVNYRTLTNAIAGVSGGSYTPPANTVSNSGAYFVAVGGSGAVTGLLDQTTADGLYDSLGAASVATNGLGDLAWLDSLPESDPNALSVLAVHSNLTLTAGAHGGEADPLSVHTSATSVAIGPGAEAGSYSFAQGYNVKAIGDYAFAQGLNNFASDFSFVAGTDLDADPNEFMWGNNDPATRLVEITTKGQFNASFGATNLWQWGREGTSEVRVATMEDVGDIGPEADPRIAAQQVALLDPTGWQSDVATFDLTTNQLTVMSPGVLWYNGSSQTVASVAASIPTNRGLWFVYFDNNGTTTLPTTVTVSQVAWDLQEVQLATVYRDPTRGQALIAREMHSVMPWTVHRRFHLVPGSAASWSSGGGITVTGGTNWSITSTYIFDEDLYHLLPATNQCYVATRDGSTGYAAIQGPTLALFATNAAGAVCYDLNGTNTAVSGVGVANYFSAWIYGIKLEPASVPSIVVVAGQQSATLATIQGESPPSGIGAIVPGAEAVLLHQVILRGTTATYVEARDLRTSRITSSATTSEYDPVYNSERDGLAHYVVVNGVTNTVSGRTADLGTVTATETDPIWAGVSNAVLTLTLTNLTAGSNITLTGSGRERTITSSASGVGRTLLYSTNLASPAASVTFNNIPTNYAEIVVVAFLRAGLAIPTVTYNYPIVTCNGDSSAVYDTNYKFTLGTATLQSSGGTASTSLQPGWATTPTDTAGIFAVSVLHMIMPSPGGYTRMFAQCSAPRLYTLDFQGAYRGSAFVTQQTWSVYGASNVTGSAWYFYGVN